ncbi:MAG: phosphatidylinositol alpha 1,6-mannosyltransferase [Sphingomonadales bacterium]|nr:phosphatidylinositol alpha 1,6-mannosyltransferase [Sphingomonadales bacterium]
MRIALFSGNYNYLREGANQALNRLAGYLGRNGHQVRVYSPVTDTPAFEPEGELVPVPSISLPIRREFRLALGLPRAVREDVRRFDPDVVHVSTPDILGTRAQTFAKRLGVPVVASLHTRFETYFRYYGLGALRPPAEAHLRRFYRRSDHVLAPTPVIVEEMKRLRGDDRVTLWSRGVDRDLFDPKRRDPEWRRAHGFADDDVVLLFFGRLVVEKGIADFVSTVLALRQRPIRIRPLIVGAGPARHRFEPLGDAVFAGHLEGPALARAVASADILLHPSQTEAFGNVVPEAMASGLAVVCAEAQSARALAAGGRSIVICRPEGFADEVAELYRNAGRRRALGILARQESARFDWDEASSSVLKAYESVIGA